MYPEPPMNTGQSSSNFISLMEEEEQEQEEQEEEEDKEYVPEDCQQLDDSIHRCSQLYNNFSRTLNHKTSCNSLRTPRRGGGGGGGGGGGSTHAWQYNVTSPPRYTVIHEGGSNGPLMVDLECTPTRWSTGVMSYPLGEGDLAGGEETVGWSLGTRPYYQVAAREKGRRMGDEYL